MFRRRQEQGREKEQGCIEPLNTIRRATNEVSSRGEGLRVSSFFYRIMTKIRAPTRSSSNSRAGTLPISRSRSGAKTKCLLPAREGNEVQFIRLRRSGVAMIRSSYGFPTQRERLWHTQRLPCLSWLDQPNRRFPTSRPGQISNEAKVPLTPYSLLKLYKVLRKQSEWT